jgi:hypothetical protein
MDSISEDRQGSVWLLHLAAALPPAGFLALDPNPWAAMASEEALSYGAVR